MASAPQPGLPLLYKNLMPLSSQVHASLRLRQADAGFLRTVHAVPLLSEEFIPAHRHFPIVFSSGENPVPLALFGLNDGVNVFVDENGRFPDDFYVPAYIRRYPFLLARLRPDSDELSLCVDPDSGVIGEFEDGEPLFDGTEPSARVKEILSFSETFEQSSQVTAAFVREMADLKLLTDGEFTVQPEGQAQPFAYRGFQMLQEESVRNLRGDVARKLLQNGALPLIYAHLFSLQRMSDLFDRQARRGLTPPPLAFPA